MKSDPGRFPKLFQNFFPFSLVLSEDYAIVQIPNRKGSQMDFYGNPEIKKAYQAGFNDGLQCGVDNARQFEYITEEQADDLLTELVLEKQLEGK
jgi:hypothetical protein